MKNLFTRCLVILTFVCFAFTPPIHAQLPDPVTARPS